MSNLRSIGFGRTTVALVAVLMMAHLSSDAYAASAADQVGIGGIFGLTVGKSGKCIAKAGGAKMGQQFHAWRCRKKSSHQVFVAKQLQRDWYQIRTKSGGMCLDVSGNAKKNGAPVVQWRCKGKANENQLWRIVPVKGSKGFGLKARHSGKCLHLDRAEEKVATFVQRDCKPGDPDQTLFPAR